MKQTPSPAEDGRVASESPDQGSCGTGSAGPPSVSESAQRRRGLLLSLRHFLLAIQFFTRIPITGRLADWVGFTPAMLRASAAHFPGVGWLVGGLSAGVFYGVWLALPAQPAAPWVAAVACTVFSVLLTGAFHEDGLADLVDGLGGSMNRERALDIMKDSRVGTYGALALVLAVAAKVALLVLLAQAGGAWLAALALFAAHVTSRLMPLFVIRTLAHVGDTPQSKSKPLAESIAVAGLLSGLLWWALAMALAGWLLPGAPWALAVVGALMGMGWMWRLLQRRLQGFTGDGLGATQQVSEVCFYLGLALAL